MVIVMRNTATEEHIADIQERLGEYHLRGHLVRGEERTIIGVVGATIPLTLREEMEHFPGVDHTLRITRPYKLASREFRTESSVVDVRGIKVGGGACVV
ncbi:MAG: 3-deoxy-7-phosphoheptulonate synthase, partial [Chloroflexaceae bacterium]|nr:3-deoxy-7-phosphoheptulonate synthase [Chloroflexaceae bacterium]